MQTEVLVTRKERIKNILGSRPADRIATLDNDMEFYTSGGAKSSDRFYLFAFNGPFQSLSFRLGVEEALIRFTQEPRHTLSDFKDHYKRLVSEYKGLKKELYAFDGAWAWEDIAYDKGLYFPIEIYRRQLLGIHNELSEFFASEGLPLFFHCDGNVQELMPLLAETKIKAVHPVQERCNRDLLKIKELFKGMITFIGGVGLHRLNQQGGAVLERVAQLQRGGNYIFSFDGPLPEAFDRNIYSRLLKEIEAQRI